MLGWMLFVPVGFLLQVAQAQGELNAQLKPLTGGLAPEIKLPKVKL
jgi:hypothetical protein